MATYDDRQNEQAKNTARNTENSNVKVYHTEARKSRPAWVWLLPLAALIGLAWWLMRPHDVTVTDRAPAVQTSPSQGTGSYRTDERPATGTTGGTATSPQGTTGGSATSPQNR